MQQYKLDSKQTNENGFTLLEAILATVIVGIGFVSIFSLSLFSERSLNATVDREHFEMLASQILEVIEADIDNIAQYSIDFTDNTQCADRATEAALNPSDLFNSRVSEWCQRLVDDVGVARAGDRREINYDDTGGVRNINILLESNNGEAQVVINRSFGS